MSGEEYNFDFTLSVKDLDRTTDKLMWEHRSRICRNRSGLSFVLFRCDEAISWVTSPLMWFAFLGRPDPGEPEGFRWGKQKLIATSEDLTVRFTARTKVYRWAAFRELRLSRRMILLMITSLHAVLVPRSIFASADDEARFCAFVRDRIAES